jgi:hypothetical protein
MRTKRFSPLDASVFSASAAALLLAKAARK